VLTAGCRSRTCKLDERLGIFHVVIRKIHGNLVDMS
jgi:hypothetical protein